jgi:hypothetical protein
LVLPRREKTLTLSKEQDGAAWVSSNRVFAKWNGEPMNPDTAAQWFRKLIDRQDSLPEGTMHSLRHRNATIRIANGMNIAAEAAATDIWGKALSQENIDMARQTKPAKKIRRIH